VLQAATMAEPTTTNPSVPPTTAETAVNPTHHDGGGTGDCTVSVNSSSSHASNVNSSSDDDQADYESSQTPIAAFGKYTKKKSFRKKKLVKKNIGMKNDIVTSEEEGVDVLRHPYQ
jgi:hypothetical protein